MISNEHVPTPQLRQRIADLAIAGIPLYLICEIVELDDDTVRKHYKKELNTAEPIAIERVAKTVVMQAMNGDSKAQNLYMKTKGAKYGWVEKQVIEQTESKETQALMDKIQELEKKYERDY